MKHEAMIRPWLWMDGNLEVDIFEVIVKHEVVLPDRGEDGGNFFHHELELLDEEVEQ